MSAAVMLGHRPRVLFCTYSHNVWGGIESWLAGLALYLHRQGLEVWVGLAKGARFNDPDAFRKAFPELATIEFDGRTGTQEGRIRAVLRVFREIRPDVVIPVGLGDAFLAAARAKQSGQALRVLAPVRATSAEIMAEMERCAPVIDLCIGNNPLHSAFLVRRGAYPTDRLRTIVNGVALPLAERSTPFVAKGTLRLLFVGRLHAEHKRIFDLPVLVEELERRRVNFRLSIVGEGAGREALIQRMGSRAGDGTVSFLGYVRPDRISTEIFPAHDALIHLSPSEGCPQAVQQAMAHGVVPICSEFLGAHSLGFLRNGETCGLFPVGDMKCAADHVGAILREPARWSSMARAGRQAMSEFEMGQVRKTWEAAIDDIGRLPPREPERGLRALAAVAPGGSRLERLGAPPAAADWLRRVLRRFPEFADGWTEWPGTLATPDEQTRMSMIAELREVDEQARQARTRSQAPAKNALAIPSPTARDHPTGRIIDEQES